MPAWPAGRKPYLFVKLEGSMTQHQAIMDYIDEFGSITPIQAFADLGITKLSTRVGELICLGVDIEKTEVKAKNRYGEPTRYMKYSFPKKN
jgi:hypothetical protein